MHFLFNDKQFYKTMFQIAIPIAAQNLVASSLNMVDTIMIGRLGETEIAAVGLANQLFFLFTLLLVGVCSGTAIYTAQYWGKRDIKNIRRVMGIGLITSLASALLFSIAPLFFSQQVMGIFSTDASVIALGSEYLFITGFSYLITAITFSYAFVLRSTEQVKLPMVLGVVALAINTVLNYVLIFGHMGFPALGVKGAAIGTVIARVVEVVLILGFVYVKKHVPAAGIKEMLDVTGDFVRRYFKTTFPVIVHETMWALGITIYAIVYGRMGIGAVASVNIAGTIERIAMVLFFGLASAAGVMTGNQIGAGDEKRAYDYGGRFLILGPLLASVMGLLMILLSPFLLRLFHVSPEISMAAQRILLIMGLVLPVRMLNMINMIGVMRSGGDTKFPLYMDLVGVWGIGIPLALIGGLLLGLPIVWVILLVSLEELFKLVVGVRRFVSKKWINNLVNHMESDAPLQEINPLGNLQS